MLQYFYQKAALLTIEPRGGTNLAHLTLLRHGVYSKTPIISIGYDCGSESPFLGSGLVIYAADDTVYEFDRGESAQAVL